MSNRTQWFRQARWGVFCHFLYGTINSKNLDEWNSRVEGFDVHGLAAQLVECKAKYFFLTLTQNSGYFCSPNKTYDSLVGRTPSRCTQRDLIADMIEALRPYGIKMMVYLPSHAPADDRQAVEGLKCTPSWDASQWQLKPGMYLNTQNVDAKLTEFQENWQAIIAEWSNRWGEDVHGWWFDGCYYYEKMYRDAEGPNFRTFAAAARSGNENSIVAFNTGVHLPVWHVTEYEDYTAGEIADTLPYDNAPWAQPHEKIGDGMVKGTQHHILTYMGEYWCKGQPRFSQDFLNSYTKHINDLGGVITWDVPIETNGLIPENYIQMLKVLEESNQR